MKTVGAIYSLFTTELAKSYDKNEAEQIAILSFEHVMHYSRIDISRNKDEIPNEKSQGEFKVIINQLQTGKPIQYVLGHTRFYGLDIKVTGDVLIPRRETEELVDWIIKDIRSSKIVPSVIVDACTGSGCIALALKKEFPETRIIAIDNSEKALDVARLNAIENSLDIEFINSDVLNFNLPVIPDLIVSNPPYVLENERKNMLSLVTDFEPSSALFVTDADPLLFYRHICQWGTTSMINGGRIYFEINDRMGKEISYLLESSGFENISMKKDMQEKDRMISAIKK